MPQYMDRKQKNLDARENNLHPFITHKMKKVKPGGDYFTEIFIVLMIIFLLTVIYWKNIAGETKNQNIAEATNSLDRFSIAQTISLFIILLLIIVERMLYRARYVDPRDEEGKYCTMPEARSPKQERKKQKLKSFGMRHTLTVKLVIYYVLIFAIHIYCGFIIPQF